MWWQDRDGDEDDAQFNLSRFMPMLQEVVEDLSSNRLSTDEYPYVRPPTSESMSEHPLHSLLPGLLTVASLQFFAAPLTCHMKKSGAIWHAFALSFDSGFKSRGCDVAALTGKSMA